MSNRFSIASFFPFLIFVVIGTGFIIAGFNTGPEALTDDGYPLREFFFFMGSSFACMPLLIFGSIVSYSVISERRRNYLVENGVKTTARIVSFSPTNMIVNGRPRIRVQLEVDGPRGKYETHTHTLLYPWEVAKLEPGKTVNVYVDREKPEKMHVEWLEYFGAAPTTD